MTKVITYGTYDLFHYGHQALLEHAKALGDYLIVGVTADDFDKNRGKINVRQSLMERIENVKRTGLADEIIVEEYEGQKIDDIRRYGVDIFTVGSDWEGKFDYLKDYCKVVYLPRTEGVSSSQLRSETKKIKMGFFGDSDLCKKYKKEASFVNGLEISDETDYEKILDGCKAVYISNHAKYHYETLKRALEKGLHVVCESPLALKKNEAEELFSLSNDRNLVLLDAIKTAYSTAYNRMLLFIKSGGIGRVLSVDSVCTSLQDLKDGVFEGKQGSMFAWGSTAMLPVLQILGTNFNHCNITSYLSDKASDFDLFTKLDFLYDNGSATVKVGKGVKSEGSLVVSGTEGYIYVPAPWWKTDYFELRKENSEDNRRFFYRLDGEGIRYMLVSFVNSIQNKKLYYVDSDVSLKISSVFERFIARENFSEIR